MPIYEIVCKECSQIGEVIVLNSNASLTCPTCGSVDTAKIMSATSSITGRVAQHVPGPSDTTCCGSTPGQAACAGPGSCCGKAQME
ncbi:MAG: zinc ribbon domain-containing protein [Deltaproteobacteria bacterium]|nr:zinc ribbon domain-containing protein [Deltaproteobacteria bacterium]